MSGGRTELEIHRERKRARGNLTALANAYPDAFAPERVAALTDALEPPTMKTTPTAFRLEPELIARVDRYADAQGKRLFGRAMTRTDAVRMLLRDALTRGEAELGLPPAGD